MVSRHDPARADAVGVPANTDLTLSTWPGAGMSCDLGRRRILGAAGWCTLGALVGIHWETVQPATTRNPRPFDAWIAVEANGAVIVWVAKAEMGQGVLTALPMLLAEELDIDWEQIRVRQAPVDPARYDHLTVGSSSIQSLWNPLRIAGARARAGLIRAAAAQWQVSPDACRTQSGAVLGPDGRKAGYAQLASEAALLVPDDASPVTLKRPDEFRLIGHPKRRLDAPEKVDGSACYGIDVRLPQMLRAVIARCPTLGGRIRSFDPTSAKAVPGVLQVFPIDPIGRDAFTRGGVAVVATDTWTALEGRRRLAVQWDVPPHRQLSTRAIVAALHRNVSRPGLVVGERGQATVAATTAARVIKASYEVPFLAHVTMEPMNATVVVRSNGVEAWIPTQNAADARTAIARVLNRAPDSVTVHQTLLGGGFGRRDATDFVVEAAQVAAKARGPVQLLWSREDDLQFDRFRPAAVHRLRATLDKRGFPQTWLDRMSSVSIAAFLEPGSAKPEETEVGGARELPYEVPWFRIEYTPATCPVPVGWWRSVQDSINAFAVESFIDELAAAAARDPLDYRLQLLSGSRSISDRDGEAIETDRLRRVLIAAATQAEGALPPPRGRARGVACHTCRGSYIATVVEVSAEERQLVVHRIWAAVDCGMVVNPLGVDAQISGGLQFAVSAALYEAISIDSGRVVQTNFTDYPVLRMAASPRTEVQILPSSAPPSGVGEIAVPPVAPAVANALFNLTGVRLRTLPLQSGLTGALGRA
jgi:isoquinoline 1-oxidoreductase beta subunit